MGIQFRSDDPPKYTDTDFNRQVTKSAIRAQSVLSVIQPVVIVLASLASLWIIIVGIIHLTGWSQTPRLGEPWLEGDRRAISAGLASLAALTITARAVLARLGKLPTPSTPTPETDDSLKDELNERFDGLTDRLKTIEGQQLSPERLAELIQQPAHSLQHTTPRVAGALNYKGGNSNFVVHGIHTGQVLKISAYRFRPQEKKGCYFSLMGQPDYAQVRRHSGSTGHLLQQNLDEYTEERPFTTTVTVPNFSAVTTPPYEAEIVAIEIDSEGPVVFDIVAVEP